MNKRKITQQQQRRITKRQTELNDVAELSGLVIANHGQNIEIKTAPDNIVLCKQRRHLGPIVPGDMVTWQQVPNTNTGVVTAIKPRFSLLSRPDQRGILHAVAANIQQMLIIFAPEPAPSLSTIDRYLIAARQQAIEPILVLNKEDLLTHDNQSSEFTSLLNVYQQIGIKIVSVSVKLVSHLDAIYILMADKNNVVVGQSGVGKSSIIATLLPELNIKVAVASTTQGKHTTTNARLYHLPHGGNIIDSPGMREFPLWNIDANALAEAFTEFQPYLTDCQFRNCLHNNEPGCGLLKAVEQGKISVLRLTSYQKILASMQK